MTYDKGTYNFGAFIAKNDKFDEVFEASGARTTAHELPEVSPVAIRIDKSKHKRARR